MKKYIKYLRYLVKHKWFVMRECFKHGIVLQGILHDISKLTPEEFFPYANFFYGTQRVETKDQNGYYKPVDTGDSKFDFAWLLHCKRNKHHWQWWVVPNENGGSKTLPIPEPYLTEMLCDWIGAGKAQGHFSPTEDPYWNVRNWYNANKERIQLADQTRKEIEKRINVTNSTNF